MNYIKIFAALFLTGTIFFWASSSYSAEIFSSPNEKLALGTELTLEDFKGQTFFASSLRKEGKGMEVRVVFDGDGNVQSIALQGSGSPAIGKVKEFDKKNLVVTASANIGNNFNEAEIKIDLKQLLFKHAYTTSKSSRHHSGTLIDSRLGCFNRLKKQKRLGCSDAQVGDFAKKYNFSQPSGDRWNTTRVFDELIKPAILDYSEENPPSSKITAKLDVKNTAVTAESEEVKTEPVSPEKTEATTTTNNSDQFTKLQLRVSSYLADIKVFLARNPDLPNLLEVLTAVSEVKTELSGKSEQDLNEAFASLEKTLSNNQDFSNFVTALKAQRQEKLDQAVKTAQALLKKYAAFLRKLITLNMVDNTDLAMALVPISKSIEEQQNSADPKALNSLIEDTNGQLAKLGLAEAFAKELKWSAAAFAAHKAKDYKTAAGIFKTLTKQGDMDAHAYLSGYYFTGRGVPKDYKKGLELARLAAEEGVKTGQWWMGRAYQEGLGVPKDLKAALAWFKLDGRRGAKQQIKKIEKELEEEIGTAKKTTAASTREVCGNPNFKKGENAVLTGYYATALCELRPLAEQGHKNSQHYLGWMYEKGYGIAQDYDLALKWYGLAAKKGHQSAKDNLKSLEKRGIVSKKVRIAREKDRIAREKVRIAREKQSLTNPGFRDLKPGLHKSTIHKKKVCQGSLVLGTTCYDLDNLKFSATFDNSGILNKLTVDLGPIVGSMGLLDTLSSFTKKGSTNIFLKTRKTLGEKYKLDFEYSERDRQLFNKNEKKKLYTVYEKGQVALLVARKEKKYSRELWLYIEYRDVKAAEEFLKWAKPKRSKKSDF